MTRTSRWCPLRSPRATVSTTSEVPEVATQPHSIAASHDNLSTIASRNSFSRSDLQNISHITSASQNNSLLVLRRPVTTLMSPRAVATSLLRKGVITPLPQKEVTTQLPQKKATPPLLQTEAAALTSAAGNTLVASNTLVAQTGENLDASAHGLGKSYLSFKLPKF